ncbi:MAG: P1 family peptidase [Gemmatimonadetes bacterium]|nr:P1 family peptidase [Gemmatimonadota bacterium]
MRIRSPLLLLTLLLPCSLAAQSALPSAREVAGGGRAALVPRTSIEGPALEFDFPAVHIGIAEYDEGPTGATVFYFPEGVKAAVDVRGGAPGTVATDFLRLAYESSFVDAISFAGGSSYGLGAAGGVALEIRDQRAASGDWGAIPTVPGAIIFDLAPRRFNTIVPDEALGRAALRAAQPGRFPLGARGAGRFAMQAGWFGDFHYRQHSGQGAAYRQVGPTKIAVFTVVNALGAVVDREGRVVRCSNDPAAAPCGPIADYLAAALERKTRALPTASDSASEMTAATQNTTLTLVVVNQKLSFWALQRLAVQVHTSMARAIQPFHTERDGDVLFAVSTGEVENSALVPEDLGALASELAWDAVLSSVPELPAVDRQVVRVEPRTLGAYAGEYEFGPGALLTIRQEGDRLLAEATGERAVYGFHRGRQWEISPTSQLDFFSENPRGDRLRFVRDGRNRVTGLTLNPGPWGISARKTPRS